MANFILNHRELSLYAPLRQQVKEIDKNIREAEAELAELNKYNVNISPVYTGMPNGNEKRDKIADFLIKLEADRVRLTNILEALKAERVALAYDLHRIKKAVNKIPDERLREIVKLHYYDGQSIISIAGKFYMSEYGVYKKLDKLLGARRRRHSK